MPALALAIFAATSACNNDKRSLASGAEDITESSGAQPLFPAPLVRGEKGPFGVSSLRADGELGLA